MAEVVDLLSAGVITPIDPINTFDISEIEQAMMYFSKGAHLGKVVVTLENAKSLLPVSSHALFHLRGEAVAHCCVTDQAIDPTSLI